MDINMNGENCLKKMRKNSLSEYKAVIFDLDGTLYYQKPFRIKMALYLVKYVITHPKSVSDIFLIKKYREVRENWEMCEKEMVFNQDISLDDRQYEYVAQKKNVGAEKVKKAVAFFMLDAPLSLLPRFRDEILTSQINILRENKVKVVVYSDYPVENKLKALGIEADYCFTSADENISSMKPDPKGLAYIMQVLKLSKDDIIMIGDRYEKDGLAAINNDVDYIIVSSSKEEREKEWLSN